MNWKFFLVGALAGALYCSAAQAWMGKRTDNRFPSAANEVKPSMTTRLSLDHRTGGFKGFGPIPNPDTPWSPNESKSENYNEDMRAWALHVAEVNEARAKVWVANAPLRAPYENMAKRRNTRMWGFARSLPW